MRSGSLKLLSLFFAVAALFLFFVRARAEVVGSQTTGNGEQTIDAGDGQNAKESESQSLKKMIDDKSAELRKIQEEREALERELKEASKTKSALGKDVKTLEYNIRQLSLQIDTSKLMIERLELELRSLGKDIKMIERNVKDKKVTIGKLMLEVYEHDTDSFMMVFLRSRSLADSVAEIQNLVALNNDLIVGVSELRSLQDDLIRKSAATQLKKRNQEIEKANFLNRQYIVQDKKEEKEKLLVQTKNQEKAYVEKIDELDRQQSEIGKVIEEIEIRIRESFDPSLLPVKRSGVLGYPIKEPIVVTQKYGKTKFAEKAYRTKFHNGIDFDTEIGTPIFAAEDGEVKAVDNNDRGKLRFQKYQYGFYILVGHTNNLSSLYAHLSRSVVNVGDKVRRGDLIGYAGNTGYSFGPHIHFTVYWSDSVQLKSVPPAAGLVPVGITVNPDDYL